MLCSVMLCYVVLCCVVLRCVVLCCVYITTLFEVVRIHDGVLRSMALAWCNNIVITSIVRLRFDRSRSRTGVNLARV